MPRPATALLLPIRVWQLNILIVFFTVILTDAVVALVEWVMYDDIGPRSLPIGTVSGLIIATLVVSAVGPLRGRMAARSRRALELDIERAKSSLNMAADTAQMLFWELDLATGVFSFDQKKLPWLGLAPETQAHTTQTWLALVHPDDQALFMARFQATLLVDSVDFDLDYRMQQTAGGWGWVHTRGGVKLRDAQGVALLAVGGTVNISKSKQMEAALEEKNQFLSALMETLPIPIFYKDTQGRYLGFNPAFEKLTGRSRAELLGTGVYDIAPKELADIYHAQDAALLAQQGIQIYEARLKNAAGMRHTVVFHKACFYGKDGAVRGLVGGILDITAAKESELALVESDKRTQALYTLLRRVADNVPDMIWAKDTQGQYLFANKAVCEQLLMAENTSEPIGKNELFFAQRERSRYPRNPDWHTFGQLGQNSIAVTLQRGGASQFDAFGHVQGKPLFLDVRKAPLLSEQGEVLGVVGSARDVTAQREAQEKLRVAALVLSNSSEALLLSDAANHIVDINPAFSQLTGYTLDEVMGKNPKFLSAGQQGAQFYKAMWVQINDTGRWQGEIWNRRKNGEAYAQWLTINTLYHDDGSVHRRVGLSSDITDKKRTEELIWKQANFDVLTGLPNRRMFLDRLTQDLKKAHRDGLPLALMFLDLDHFKEVNDTLGHTVGDTLLAEVARRITACTRDSDTVARLSGDEFTVILTDLKETSGIERIASDILAALAQPFMLGGEQAFVSVSIGITLYPQDAETPETLLKNADQAMYVSKTSGRNRFSYFTSAMQVAALYRMELLADLRGALVRQQFHVHYQPIVDLRTGQIHKAEALLRWNHPVRGAVSPAEFIPLAEDSGLIHEIGNWVFTQAAQQVQHWRASLDPAMQISVNLSPVQLQAARERLSWLPYLQSTGLNGAAIVVEITEGLLLDKSPGVTAELLAFRDAGVQVAIDDFGTGYSAMAYLNQLDIDYLKIDQSFVRNLTQDGSDHALCEAMVVMAHKLGLRVIAEGVETTKQRDLLADMGCDYAQGFLYAKALPATEFEHLLANQVTHGFQAPT